MNYKSQQYGGGSTVFFAVGVNWPSPKFQFKTIDYIGGYGTFSNTERSTINYIKERLIPETKKNTQPKLVVIINLLDIISRLALTAYLVNKMIFN